MSTNLSTRLLQMELDELREGLKFCALRPIEGPANRARAMDRIRDLEKEIDQNTPALRPVAEQHMDWKYGDKGYELRNGFSGD